MDLLLIKTILEVISSVTIILGIPIGLVRYIRNTIREREIKEYETYNALDEKFLEFQMLCLANPELDIFDVKDQTPKKLGPLEQKKELIIFTFLFSIFERAYVMYSNHSSQFKQRQWVGWEEYIKSFCQRKNFCEAWSLSGSTFDEGFQAFMSKLTK